MKLVPEPRGALNFDFAVERVEIGAHDVQADAAAGKFGFGRRGGKAGMEKHFAQIALGEAVGGFRAKPGRARWRSACTRS